MLFRWLSLPLDSCSVLRAVSRKQPQATKAGNWPRLSGVALEKKKIGILGLGAIGKAVAKRLRAFECHILAYDPLPDQDFARRNDIQMTTLADMLPVVDFLSLHLPVTEETRGMVNGVFLSKMKAGAFLINTARGELVDENALAAALKSGHLRGAALDAFCPEPPDPHNPLLALNNVIVTPHSGAHADFADAGNG